MDEDLTLFKEALGKQIAFIRKKKGITQPELGSLIGRDFQSISRIERGKVNISIYLLKQIATALNVTANDLIYF
ncbi:helix-turn-helix domain-containing protein [Mucilaginibacter sp. 22184]|uniref:helix-turn-helix domain-containing protein n=1 Tax=Mucilaginibacter sp. 22184 TaxID=3453887 RepID=UPI003F86D253